MASAAAVSADIDRPPIDNDLDESGGVTSTIIPNNPAEEDDDDDDEDEDIQRKGRRTDRVNQANGDDDDEDPGELDGDDLFGDDDDDALPEEPTAEAPRRELDDEDLDSGDDEGRLDRIGHEGAEEEQEMQEQEKIVMDIDLPRQAGPEPSDGEMYVLKVPDFMNLHSKAWKPSDFQPPTADHHSKTPSTTFSPYNTAMTTLRWRRSPNNPSELQSNARILRWSDGSLTVQLASDPLTQYETNANPLAPPQRNPIKPTPTSINKISGKGGRPGASTAQGGSALAEKYNEKKDTFTYLVAPNPAVGSLRVSNKITAGLKIKQSASIVDDAITQLQTSLAAASNASRVQGTSGDLMIVDEDPELARRRAELAEREKARARKRNEAQKERENERMGRTAGRFGSSRGGGLNASMLEDEEELGFASQGRVGKGGAKPKRPRQRRANSEYSSDEDYGRRGFQSKADEYDEEDDFVARSDEEEIVEDDDDDDDDGIREGSPKRGRGGDDDEDAAGEDDDEAPVQAAKKRRKVVLDDEEED